jgi:hypothetical protein
VGFVSAKVVIPTVPAPRMITLPRGTPGTPERRMPRPP